MGSCSTRQGVLAAGTALGVVSLLAAGAVHAADAEVIDLTQTGCQFVEAENGVDHGFETTQKADCEAINAETGTERLASAKVLELEPGEYVFRVTNRNVPYELGFWLREADYQLGNPVHKLTKISVSGGGLGTGQTKDYEVELAPGDYLYSCPLNPTHRRRRAILEPIIQEVSWRKRCAPICA
jgi:hypothetical protein